MKRDKALALCAVLFLFSMAFFAKAAEKTGDLFQDYGMGPEIRPPVPSDYYRREEMVTPNPAPMVPQGGMYGSSREMESLLPDDMVKPRQGDPPQYDLYDYPPR